MAFKMKPGSKNVDSPGTFRMDSPLKEAGFAIEEETVEESPVSYTKPKLEKCHSSDAACLKRNRAARKSAADKDRMARYEAHKKTGADYYVGPSDSQKRQARREHGQ